MPLYEYRCPGCGRRFEVLQRVGQGSVGVVCPDCGRPNPEKQHSTFASGGADAGTGSGCGGSGRFT
jgi:putative FmdB family regulatory protein